MKRSEHKMLPTEDLTYRILNSQKEWENKREEIRKKEEKRVKAIKCPLCKSNKKSLYQDIQHNGIYGPGSFSNITNEYLICLNCGMHYSDLNKNK